MNLDELKKQAGIRAADLVQSGQKIGLGTGSTAAHVMNRLAERIRTENLKIQAVSTSWSTTLLCRELKIPLLDVGEVEHLDIAIDGADEIDGERHLIKGRGAAHLIEKVVASMADQFVIVADASKKVDTLGTSFAVPLEILPLAIGAVRAAIRRLEGKLMVRPGTPGKDGPVISDSGNLICDAQFGQIQDVPALAQNLQNIPGLVEHGLFVGMATRVILATPEGLVEF